MWIVLSASKTGAAREQPQTDWLTSIGVVFDILPFDEALDTEQWLVLAVDHFNQCDINHLDLPAASGVGKRVSQRESENQHENKSRGLAFLWSHDAEC